MLRQKAKNRFTPAEYLAMEEVADYKSEFYGGRIYAMTGGSRDHSVISVNVSSGLNVRLAETPCVVFNSDMRLSVEANGLYTYPDVMVICGAVEMVKKRTDIATNPLLIVEVLSESTRNYDRGIKFNLYKQIPTLQEYVLIDSEKPHVECFRRRAGEEWSVQMLNSINETLALESIGCELPLRQIYAKVTWG